MKTDKKTLKIGIIAAEEEEMLAMKFFLKNIKEETFFDLTFITGNIGNKKCILVKSGVGKVNAARTTQLLIDHYQVNYVINIGSAGAVDKNLCVNDIVIASQLVQYDFDITQIGNYEKGEICDLGKYISSDSYLIDLCKNAIDALENKNFQTKIGIIASADTFCGNPEKAHAIREEFQAECVEMEGASVAQVCYLDNVPFLVIRGISDTPNGNNPIDFHTYLISASKQVAKVLQKMILSMP